MIMPILRITANTRNSCDVCADDTLQLPFLMILIEQLMYLIWQSHHKQ